LVSEQLAAEGAGVITGGVVGAAAALVAMAARHSDEWPEASAVLGQAESLQRRAERLAAENARRYAVVLRAFAGEGDLGQALDQAAETPLRLAEAANDVALLAVYTAERCEPRLRADVLAAASLAAGAARAAAELVAANLAATAEDERVARAWELAAATAAAIRP